MLNFGGFLSSNFWTNYRCTSSASIEDLLNNKDCSVDKLLDDDDCLQEFKNYNDKLIKYFDHDKLKILIDYITVMPDKDDGHNRGRKYPFITGEIFNCEINQILDKFFEAPVKVKEVKTEEKDDDKDDDDDEKESPDGKESDDNKNDDEDEKKEKEEDSKREEDAEKDKLEDKQEDDADVAKTAAAKNLEEAEDGEVKEKEAKQESEPSANNPQDKSEEQAAATDADGAAEAQAELKEKLEESKSEDDKDKNTQEPESEEQAKKNKEGDGAKEPEEEETAVGQKEASESLGKEKEAEKDPAKIINNLTTQSVASTLVTEEGEPEEEEEGKHVLLDRLFKFIRTEGDEQLNPVLSGYFCKLVSLLISRKQKSLVPYIFAPNSDIIENMLKHIYQKSISEVLNKLLTQIDGDYEPEIMAEIKSKQQLAVTKLIDLLGPDLSEEHNLNACTIIQDMFEIKEFYNIICKRESLTKIVNFSTAAFGGSTKTSKSCSLIVLNQIITNHIDRQKKKDQKGDDKTENTNDDDDDMVQHNSEDEDKEDTEANNPNSATVQTNILVDILKDRVGEIQDVLRGDHEGAKTRISVCDTEFVPLGQQRLHTVELVSKMVQLKKEPIFNALTASQTFANIMVLVKSYPWNNFLQLKVINLFEQIFNNVDNEAFKNHVLEQTQLAKSLAELGAAHQYEMESERKIRNGHMALVVSISNLLIKKTEAEASEAKAAPGDNEAVTASGETKKVISDFLAKPENAEPWKAWVDGELKKSNDNNKRPLGGSVSSRLSEEDDKDDNNYDVQMEKIMARFTNFNQILSSGGSQEEDDDEEEDENTHDSGDKNDDGFDEDDDDKKTEDSTISSFGQSDVGIKLQKVNLIVPEALAEEYIDNTYWKIGEPKPEEVDVDALLAELEA